MHARPLLCLFLLACCEAPAGRPPPAPSASPGALAPARPSASAAAASGSEADAEPWVGWLPDGQVAAVSLRDAVYLVDAATGERQTVNLRAGRVVGLAVAPQGGLVAFATEGGVVGVVRVSGGIAWSTTVRGERPGAALRFSADGRRLAMAGERLRVWAMPEGVAALDVEVPEALRGHGVTLHEDQRHALFGGGAWVQAFDLREGKPVGERLDTRASGPASQHVTPDGRWVIAGAEGGREVGVWRTLPWLRVATLARASREGGAEARVDVVMSADGQRLLVHAGGAWQRVFEVGSWKALRYWEPKGPGWMAFRGATAYEERGDGLHAVDTGSRGAGVHLGKQVGRPELSPTGAHLLQAEAGGYVIHETATGKETASFRPAAGP